MRNIKKYEDIYSDNISVGRYITFSTDISIDDGVYVIKAFKPYMIDDISHFSFSINYKESSSLWIENDDEDIIFLPDNFTNEYLNMLEQTYKYNL